MGPNSTHHTLTNFISEISGRDATLTAYLNAAHVVQEGGVVNLVDVAHGTYRLQLEKRKGKWLVTALSLTLIDFNPYFP